MSKEILMHEINEQPEVIERLLDQESGNIQSIVSQLRGTFDNVVIAARGTSDNAALYAKYLFGSKNEIPVALAAPSLFTTYQTPPKMNRALVLAISQSGQSPDVISVVKEGHRQGQPTLAITNDPASPLAKMGDFNINLRAGREEAVAATKSYTASLTTIAMMSLILNGQDVDASPLRFLPDWIENTLILNSDLVERVKGFSELDSLFVISRGYDYATTNEISIKLKELAQVNAEPYSAADFLHGPIALLNQDAKVLLIATPGRVFFEIYKLLKRIRKITDKMFVISDNEEILGSSDIQMPVQKYIPSWLFPIVSIVPGQILSLGLAKAKHLDPDFPKGLTKVTKTW